MNKQTLSKGAAALTALAIFGASGLGFATTASADEPKGGSPDMIAAAQASAAAMAPAVQTAATVAPAPQPTDERDGGSRGRRDDGGRDRGVDQDGRFGPLGGRPVFAPLPPPPPATIYVDPSYYGQFVPAPVYVQPSFASLSPANLVSSASAMLGLPSSTVLADLEQGATLSTIAQSMGWSRDAFAATLVGNFEGSLANDVYFSVSLNNLSQQINQMVDQPGLQMAQQAISSGLVWT
jgi:hypothetical protein